ncbi:hypothetical protein PENANT_c003G07604 [Penicillium antarcticum]|uniref:Uncharacterized protein n=1 Tax=Penicillium antarcticum TaxID=416450 RepID=A0A1V6QHE0_9EURO|nr:hypothetical protein PENANT_c003G07604 [Penicillium antarcticum]
MPPDTHSQPEGSFEAQYEHKQAELYYILLIKLSP